MHYAAYSQAERALAVQRRQRYAGVVVGQAEGQDDATQQQEAVLKADAGRARYGLTAEQIRVVRLLAQGLTPVELGRALGIADSGARSRTKKILRRLQVNTILEACVKAGLMDDSEEAEEIPVATTEEPEEEPETECSQPEWAEVQPEFQAHLDGMLVPRISESYCGFLSGYALWCEAEQVPLTSRDAGERYLDELAHIPSPSVRQSALRSFYEFRDPAATEKWNIAKQRREMLTASRLPESRAARRNGLRVIE